MTFLKLTFFVLLLTLSASFAFADDSDGTPSTDTDAANWLAQSSTRGEALTTSANPSTLCNLTSEQGYNGRPAEAATDHNSAAPDATK